jgi:hypothetical protein
MKRFPCAQTALASLLRAGREEGVRKGAKYMPFLQNSNGASKNQGLHDSRMSDKGGFAH